MMERQLEQMVRLVDDLLDMARISQGKIELRKERVELAAVIRSAVEAVSPFIEAQGHELTVTLPTEAGLHRCRCDAAGSGLLEPAEQRRQVHRAGRPHLA